MSRGRCGKSGLAMVVLATAACPLAWAQTVTPGQVVDTLEKPPALSVPTQPPTLVPPKPAPRPAPSSTAEERRIAVQRFEFTGNILFSEAHLAQQLQDLIGKPISMLELYDAADRIAALYANHGYTLATVNLPPQRVSDGTVTLQISEGRVSRIEIANAKRYPADEIRRYLGNFREGQIYRADSLQDRLRQISALPGLSVKATVRPGNEIGSSDIVLTLAETPLQGSVSLDNHGRESVGELRLNAAVAINNPLYIGDQLQLTGLVSEDELTRYGGFSYSRPVSHHGTRLRLAYAHAEFEVENSPVSGRSRTGEIAIEHPLVFDARQRLALSIGATRAVSNADFSGLIFNQTEISLMRLGLVYSIVHDSTAVTQILTSVSSNFKSLSIEDVSSADVPGNQRVKWTTDVQHLQPLTPSLQLFVRAAAAWSPDPLVDTEKYSLGGPGSVRGFPGAELRGDYGYFGSVSLQHLATLPPVSLRSRLFVDAGEVFAIDAPDAGSLSSVGLGFDLVRNPLSLRLDWAYPLGSRESSDGRNSGRVFGTLAASF